MNNQIIVLEEPLLEFRYGQTMVDPHDGLSIFGPYDTDLSSHPHNILYGVIGTQNGLTLLSGWTNDVMIGPCREVEPKKNLWPPFPGFEAAFHSKWAARPTKQHVLDHEDLIHLSRNRNPFERTTSIVAKYTDGIAKFQLQDESIDVLLCIVPDEVWKNCRSESVIVGGWGAKPSKSFRTGALKGQQSIDGVWEPDTYRYSIDFRRQIKAKCMQKKTSFQNQSVPIQIIRESTLVIAEEDLNHRRGLTPVSDRAWNISTTLYYKAGGKPWRLASARDGVCYIGITYKKTEPDRRSKTACCAAQMFLNSGDGVVFLGDAGPWYSPEDDEFHLSREAAKKLLDGVLSKYSLLEGKPLREIFLHCRSEINRNEFDGFREACPEGVKLVGIRVRLDNEMKMYRKGKWPIPRGTFLKRNESEGHLWANGYKWRLQTYDGWQVPRPVKIDIMHGNAPIEQVANDILSLTKLNYNACKLGSSEPVTIGFSDAVGEILVSNPLVKEPSPLFKYYI